jgi:hypothetical protein
MVQSPVMGIVAIDGSQHVESVDSRKTDGTSLQLKKNILKMDSNNVVTSSQQPNETLAPISRAPVKPGKGKCFPVWIRRAPRWLRVAFIVSIFTMLGAIVLVGVSFSVDNKSNNSESNAMGSSTMDDVSLPPTPMPRTIVEFINPTMSPQLPLLTEIPTGKMESLAPTAGFTSLVVSSQIPSLRPFPFSTLVPSFGQANDQSSNPTVLVDEDITTFYATTGRFSDEFVPQLPGLLSGLPRWGGNAVMFHLGDWNSPTSQLCSENIYANVSSLFSTSSVPVYFVVGDNEFNGKLAFAQPIANGCVSF